MAEFELSYTGNMADSQKIDFYDITQALWGFERTISLTTNLLINGKVATQSPQVKGFKLLAEVPEAGSWKFKTVMVVGTSIGALGMAPSDTAFGWLTKSAIDYVVSESLGFNPNFDKTLGVQIENFRREQSVVQIDRDLFQERFDSLLEKTESGLRAIHRPIVFSSTADVAQISCRIGTTIRPLKDHFSANTYEYVSKTIRSEDFSKLCGVISSYNSNTFKGRLFLPDENRTVPFELSDNTRVPKAIGRIVSSLRDNATARSRGNNHREPDICLFGAKNESSSGRLKSLFVVEVRSAAPNN